MAGVHPVADVRAAEAALMAELPEGALMQRAATGLATACAGVLPRVAGARVVLLVGTGNNGGDALWAGARLAGRGVRVDAITLGARIHPEGAAALLAAGGRVHDPSAGPALLAAADLVVDGILGIGGSGALRPPAAQLAQAAAECGAMVIAVDVPSGVDADTGAVAGAAVAADLTITFGCLKPGFLVAPGRDHAGAVALVDIGLGPFLPAASVRVLDDDDIAAWVPEPGADDYKYSRGVVGIAAGSARYRGAAFMATGGARHSSVGMVHYLDRGDGLAAALVDRFWDVVASAAGPAQSPRVQAWVVGPGLGLDDAAATTLDAVLATPGPVVVDADALHLLAAPRGRAALVARRGLTVLTPHAGEFAALGFRAGDGADADRLGAARHAAAELGAIVVLKGPGTVIAAPDGQAVIDTRGGPELGTAGSGDVLSGLVGGVLAGAAARRELGDGDVPWARAVAAVGSAVALHGLAGAGAAGRGRPVCAPDIVDALPDTIAAVRRGEDP